MRDPMNYLMGQSLQVVLPHGFHSIPPQAIAGGTKTSMAKGRSAVGRGKSVLAEGKIAGEPWEPTSTLVVRSGKGPLGPRCQGIGKGKDPQGS